MQVSTIIVSYNTLDLTRQAVDSALASSPDIGHEVIVVDNNSPDDSGRILREDYSQDERVAVVELDKNAGFSAANNVGAERARGEVLFFLNPDTVVHESAIGKLYVFLTTHPKAGIVGPHVLNPDGTDQASVGSFVSIRTLMRHYFPVSALFRRGVMKRPNIPQETTEVDMVTGCAIALRREVFDRVGGWDESYFLYAEERELCYAVKNLGFRNYFLPSASIVHIGGASTSREDYAAQQIIQQKSALQFLRRHHGGVLVHLNRIMGLLGFGTRAILFPVLKHVSDESDYAARGEAARTIFRWFLSDYGSGEQTA